MGSIRYTAEDPDGYSHGLHDHEGYVGQVFEDGTIHGGGEVVEVNRRTVAFRAACDCGWLGETILPRVRSEAPDYDSAWPEWEEVPVLEAEWMAHTDPLLEALAREHGVTSANPDPLAAVRIPTQEAGAQIAAALRACDELGAAGPDVADIRGWLTEAARLIGRVEVRSCPARQHWPVDPGAHRVPGRHALGSVARGRRSRGHGRLCRRGAWLGHGYGPPTFTAVQPNRAEWAALWRTEGHPTPVIALATLVDHLERPGGGPGA